MTWLWIDVADLQVLAQVVAAGGGAKFRVSQGPPPAPIPKPVADPIQRIKEVVSEAWGITESQLVGQNRRRDLVTPRHVGMYLARELTDAPITAVADAFGGRDHSTALYAVEKIARNLRQDADLRDKVERVRQAVCTNGDNLGANLVEEVLRVEVIPDESTKVSTFPQALHVGETFQVAPETIT